jgi:hypothetical protein
VPQTCLEIAVVVCHTIPSLILVALVPAISAAVIPCTATQTPLCLTAPPPAAAQPVQNTSPGMNSITLECRLKMGLCKRGSIILHPFHSGLVSRSRPECNFVDTTLNLGHPDEKLLSILVFILRYLVPNLCYRCRLTQVIQVNGVPRFAV